MEQEKRHDAQEEFPEANHGEVGDVTITEYRKNQIVRLAECLIISPMCIYAGIRYRKELPKWLSALLVVGGTATLIYNGRNFIVNHRRDGKLIRQAIKQKKEEEKKIRDKIIRVDNKAQKPAEKKQEQSSSPPAPRQASEYTTTPAQELVGGNVVPNEGVSVKLKPDSSMELSETIQPIIVELSNENNLEKVVISDSATEQITSTFDTVGIKENIESEDDKKKEVESAIEKPIILHQIPKDNVGNNGNESKAI